ncbi:hypothetical protein JKP88DRAFT_255037 [Tribonema minus]|uniref:Uncharacterized protein n=1 Tax=Tribonema minus TaxID=303371 RepID=A0A835Z2V5_9STRA|nr:hypothetical protein JKP88DRAFT_255037 [Tribonema minus]
MSALSHSRQAADAACTSTRLEPRGLLLIGDRGVTAEAYAPLMDAVRALAGRAFGPAGLFDLDPLLVTMPYEEGATTEAALGSAVRIMAQRDAQYWAVVGHREGAEVANLLAAAMHPCVNLLGLRDGQPHCNTYIPPSHRRSSAPPQPRVKLLALLDGAPHFDVGAALRDKNLVCLVATPPAAATAEQCHTAATAEPCDAADATEQCHAGDVAAALAAQLQRHPGDVVRVAMPPLLDSGGGGGGTGAATGGGTGAAPGGGSETFQRLVQSLVQGLATLPYPEVMAEVAPYLLSNSQVKVEATTRGYNRWLTFAPANNGAVRASLLFLQGVAVPIEAYAGFGQRLAALGYVCVIAAAPGRDAGNLSQEAITEASQHLNFMCASPWLAMPALIVATRLPLPNAQIMDAHADISSGNWFIGGHSGAGAAASGWMLSNLDLLAEGGATRAPIAGPPGNPKRVWGLLLLSGGVYANFKDDERARRIPILQVVGTRDGGYRREPDSLTYYMKRHILPFAPASSVTLVPIELTARLLTALQGGTHYGFGYFGYKAPFLLGWISREQQQQAAAEAADAWMRGVMGRA